MSAAPQLLLSLEEPFDTKLVTEWDQPLRVAGLFAGIGGIEHGLHKSGHETKLLCEIEPNAVAVLVQQFGIKPELDVRNLTGKTMPRVDVLAGGFPCQDLSQAGRTVGISGTRSGLVGEMFRIVDEMKPKPTWILFENVPFMLQLDQGRALHHLTRTLGEMGWVWAYRVVDTRAFGLPQRRQRVIFLASRTHDPRCVLFGDEAGPREFSEDEGAAFGFYWTEGRRGLGWAVDAVPTLKGGSTIGIPSPPAIWMPNGDIVTPDIRDAERLQGFPANWTSIDANGGRRAVGARWKMVGNAVSVPVAKWVGMRLRRPKSADFEHRPFSGYGYWPNAAWGYKSTVFQVDVSMWPVQYTYKRIGDFLKYPTVPLSLRATEGFRSRTREAKLRFKPEFLAALDAHIERMREKAA